MTPALKTNAEGYGKSDAVMMGALLFLIQDSENNSGKTAGITILLACFLFLSF